MNEIKSKNGKTSIYCGGDDTQSAPDLASELESSSVSDLEPVIQLPSPLDKSFAHNTVMLSYIRIVNVKLGEGASLPEYKTDGAAGADIFASEGATVAPGGTVMVGTGLFMEIPAGFEAQIRSRSGLAAKHGVFVLNSPGTIDSDYRGEVKVILHNTGSAEFKVSSGDRIAQMVLAEVPRASFVVVDDLSSSERGDGGFGHTGV